MVTTYWGHAWALMGILHLEALAYSTFRCLRIWLKSKTWKWVICSQKANKVKDRLCELQCIMTKYRLRREDTIWYQSLFSTGNANEIWCLHRRQLRHLELASNTQSIAVVLVMGFDHEILTRVQDVSQSCTDKLTLVVALVVKPKASRSLPLTLIVLVTLTALSMYTYIKCSNFTHCPPDFYKAHNVVLHSKF